jgi:hypothetical protein
MDALAGSGVKEAAMVLPRAPELGGGTVSALATPHPRSNSKGRSGGLDEEVLLEPVPPAERKVLHT